MIVVGGVSGMGKGAIIAYSGCPYTHTCTHARTLVRPIKTCLNETYSRVRAGKYLSDMFPVTDGLKQGDALSPLVFNFTLEYDIRKVNRIA